MESFFSRYKNPLLLMAVLFIQVIMLATQVRRLDDPKNPASGGARLIRVWAVNVITPVEKAFIGTGHFFRNTWRNHLDLHDVREQNRKLQAEVDRLRMEQAKLKEDAEQAHRLQILLDFKEKFIGATLAAQVIGSSGSEQSRVIYIDKGSDYKLKPNMAVITPDGIVGKVKEVYATSSQVLMINDRDSGAGVILEKTRLQGDLHGSSQGETVVKNVMSDEKVDVGEKVITSGGDKIYPKGLPVGNVTAVNSDPDKPLFLSIAVKPAASLGRLEEVLVISKMPEELPSVGQSSGPIRAADILAQRLPTVPKPVEKPQEKAGTSGAVATPGKPAQGGAASQGKKPVAGANSGVPANDGKPAVPKMPKAPKAKKAASQPDQSPPTPSDSAKPGKPEPERPPSTTEKPPE